MIRATSHNVGVLIALSVAKKEAKRLELAAKKAAKASKATVVDAVAPEKKKEKAAPAEKAKKEEDAPFVNTTPKGHKKGTLCLFHPAPAICCRDPPFFFCLSAPSPCLISDA
jgi:hypothetical protein